MRKCIAYATLGILIMVCMQSVSADVDLDDFSIDFTDDDISVGDTLSIKMLFEGPDTTETSSFELEIQIDDVTVFLDEDYDVSFNKGNDKTITLTSNNFPGTDLDHDYFNKNLMNYQCGGHEVKVSIRGGDLETDFEYSTEYTIGDDDEQLSFEADPEDPSIDLKTTITVFDEDDDELEGATVKVTWIDDPDGDTDGEWDSDDSKWQSTTDDDGEAQFRISDKFDDDATGEYQIDVYKSGYCLSTETYNVSIKSLHVSATPQTIQPGETSAVCVSDDSGMTIYNAKLYVSGPSYSKTYYTLTDGCMKLTLNTIGQYALSASKSGYESTIDYKLGVTEVTSTTSTIKTTISSTTTLPQNASNPLSIQASKQIYLIEEKAEVKVKDQYQTPIEGARVSVPALNIVGTTDRNGVFEFSLNQAGTYRILADKGDYLSGETAITATSETMSSTSTTQTASSPQDNNQGDQGLSPDKMLLLGFLLGVSITVVAGVVIIMLFTSIQRRKQRKGMFEPKGDSKLGDAL